MAATFGPGPRKLQYSLSHHQSHLAGGWEPLDNCQFQLEPRRRRGRCRKHRRFHRRQRLPGDGWDHQFIALEVWREIDYLLASILMKTWPEFGNVGQLSKNGREHLVFL